jgi:hypothetical protein
VVSLLAGLIVTAAIVWGTQTLARALDAARGDAKRGRTLQLLALFAPGVSASSGDPRALLVWHPLSAAARTLFPEEFVELDRGGGGTFPFTRDQIQAAHSRWTADWLAWEQAHDAEYKLKAATAEGDLAASGGSPVLRARLDAIEREKLESYQRHYEEYVRVAKALQSLTGSSGGKS